MFRLPLRGMGHVFIQCNFFARHYVAEASDFSLRCPKKSHQKKGHPVGENVVAMDFILSLAEGASCPSANARHPCRD